ncbi:MAG: hypothetical protein SO172_09190, partial [Pararoseburia sp.]|nr:hypothetical protein [Pararoseburia sp.]
DISGIGDGTFTGGLAALNNSLAGKVSTKNIAVVKPKETVEITLPFNSVGFLVFNGASNTMQSLCQYNGFSNGVAIRTVGTQGSSVSYGIKSGTNNIFTVSNLATGNVLIVDAISIRGNFPQ